MKFKQLLSWWLDDNEFEEYQERKKRMPEIIQEVNRDMNRFYINRLRKEINQTKRNEPESYDWQYVDALEDIVEMLKKYDFKTVKKSACNLMKIHKNHSSVIRAYSFFSGL